MDTKSMYPIQRHAGNFSDQFFWSLIENIMFSIPKFNFIKCPVISGQVKGISLSCGLIFYTFQSLVDK